MQKEIIMKRTDALMLIASRLMRWLYAKHFRFELDKTDGHDDYQVYLGKNYIGMICGDGIVRTYQLILDGRRIGGTETLFFAKLQFVLKYWVTILFGV